MARALILVGLVLLVLGLIWHFIPGWLAWFGRLPGDIRVRRDGVSAFIPIASTLLVSLGSRCWRCSAAFSGAEATLASAITP